MASLVFAFFSPTARVENETTRNWTQTNRHWQPFRWRSEQEFRLFFGASKHERRKDGGSVCTHYTGRTGFTTSYYCCFSLCSVFSVSFLVVALRCCRFCPLLLTGFSQISRVKCLPRRYHRIRLLRLGIQLRKFRSFSALYRRQQARLREQQWVALRQVGFQKNVPTRSISRNDEARSAVHKAFFVV